MKIIMHTILPYFFILFYSFTGYAQNNFIDSLKSVLQSQKEDTNAVNTLNAIGKALFNEGDCQNSMQYANTALSLAEKIIFEEGKGTALLVIASNYYNQSNYPEVIKNALGSLKINKELKNKRSCAAIYDLLSKAYGMQGNYKENLQNAYASLKLWEEIGDKAGIANMLNELANTYTDHGNYSEGLKNAHAAIKIYNETEDKFGIVYSQGILAEIDYLNGNFPEGLKKRLNNLKILEELGGRASLSYLCDEYRGIGKIYQKQGEQALDSGVATTAMEKFLDAEKNYRMALIGNEKINSKDFIAAVCVNLADINMKFKKYAESKMYLQRSLKLSKSVGFKNAIRDSYRGLSTLDSIEGNYTQAYYNYKMYIVFRDSILNDESIKRSSELNMQYEYDKKETEAKTIQEKKDVEARLTRNLQYSALAAFLLLVIFLYWNNRQKQKAKTKIEKAYTELKATQAQLIQSEKMASLGELTAGIAHEIQNPLNFVNNFSEVNKELIDEMQQEMDKGNYSDAKEISNDIKENEEKINHHGKRADAIVKGMLQHSRSSSVVREPADVNKLADEYLRLAYHGLRAKDKSFNVTMNTDFDESIGNVNIIPQDIGRVLLNLINNAFYAITEKKKQQPGGYEPTVSVSTKKIGDKVEVKVKDNGNGISRKVLDKIFQPFFTTKPTGQGTGLGLSLAYDIIKAHGGEIKVETKEGEGSEFIIHLPLLHT